jgi:hypothetical protein
MQFGIIGLIVFVASIMLWAWGLSDDVKHGRTKLGAPFIWGIAIGIIALAISLASWH